MDMVFGLKIYLPENGRFLKYVVLEGGNSKRLRRYSMGLHGTSEWATYMLLKPLF